MAITILKGVASFIRSHASPPYKSPNEENAPSSRTSKGSSLNKERSNKRALRDGEDVGLSKGSTWHIPYFPFPLDLWPPSAVIDLLAPSRFVFHPWVKAEVHEPRWEHWGL